MIRKRDAILMIVAGLTLDGCGFFFPIKYRYRMTVQVETPDGPRTGSSVYEVSAHTSPQITSESQAGGSSLKGQAIVIDTPNGPIFALMREATSDNSIEEDVTRSLAPTTYVGGAEQYVKAVRKLGSGANRQATPLPQKYWPMLVTFSDRNDPMTLSLAKITGVTVRSVTVQVTNDPVVYGIDSYLPWLRTIKGDYLTGRPFSGGSPYGLGGLQFSSEFK